MYIEKYWGEYIGGTDDSLTLTAYLAQKGKRELGLGEVLADFGADLMSNDFRDPDPPLAYTDGEGWEMAIACGIDLISDLAALLLECRVNGSVDLLELDGTLELAEPDRRVRLTASPEELEQLDRLLAGFVSAPLEYDISQVEPEEETRALAAACEELRQELRG